MDRECGRGDGHRAGAGAVRRRWSYRWAKFLASVKRGGDYERGIERNRPSLNIGIEEEYQTVDPVTRDLRSHIHAEIVQKGKLLLAERVKPEMHQSVVEIGTGVCQNIQEAKEEIRTIRQRDHHTGAARTACAWRPAARIPSPQWREQEIYPDDRYRVIVEDLKMVARANLIFGLHVHIGVEDRETAIHLMNGARYFLPHLLALSTNSPFWLGMDTGLRSYRCKVFDKFPRTNIPDLYSSWSEFENYVNLLIHTNCIDNAKKIWWDIRPHPYFPTLEFRVCDMPMRLDETIAIAALCQAIIAKLYQLARAKPELPPLQPRAHHGEQVAGRALWTGRQDDRFRQADRGARARADRRDSGVRRRRGGRIGQPRRDRLHPQDPGERHRRGPPVARLSRDRRLQEGGGLHDRGNRSADCSRRSLAAAERGQ